MARPWNRRRKKSKPVEHILKITELGWHGDGIAEVDGKKIFVPFTLAGETVRAMVSGSRAKAVEIVAPSPEREEAPCPHFARCGGCAVQHFATKSYAEWKRHIIERALANRSIEAKVEPVIDAHGEGRRRVTLHTRVGPKGAQVGFMQTHSHKLVDIDQCPILVPGLDNATVLARDIAGVLAKNSKPLDVQLTLTETGVDCDIRGCGDLDMEAQSNLADCAISHDMARITIDGDVVMVRRPPVLTFGLAKVTLPPAGFLQATKMGEDVLARLVEEALDDVKTIADLYCGIGPFALRLAPRAQVLAFDSDEAAIDALTDAAHHTQGQKPVSAKIRDLIHNPLHADEMKNFDAVIFDPPRAGAESQAFEIAGSKVKTIVAVSCNPATFARDASILIDGGYRLEKVTPVDQFRYAGHVELVGIFRR